MKICQDCHQFKNRATNWNNTHGVTTDPLPYISEIVKGHKDLIFEKKGLMEQDGLQVFSGVASVSNGGNSLLGQQWDSLILDLTSQNIILHYNYFIGNENCSGR